MFFMLDEVKWSGLRTYEIDAQFQLYVLLLKRCNLCNVGITECPQFNSPFLRIQNVHRLPVSNSFSCFVLPSKPT